MSKKQNSISLSTAEAEYIVAGSCCTQLLWMKKLLHEYEIPQEMMSVFYDNTSAINLSKNLVQHSKSKHIEIRYVLNSFTQTTKRRTSSLNLSMVLSSNCYVRPLVSVSFLETHVLCVLIPYFVCPRFASRTPKNPKILFSSHWAMRTSTMTWCNLFGHWST